MEVFCSLKDYRSDLGGIATIGTFDGVHLGHQTILQRLLELSQQLNGESVVITFEPHPRQVLYPEDNDLKLLTLLPEKLALLEQLGINRVLVIPFDREFSRMTAELFVKQVLVETVKVKYVTVGYDHRFGKNRTGGIQEMMRLGKEHNFGVEEIPAHQIDSANVSSTKIRAALRAGDINKANRLLGYAYHLTGRVIHGDKRGHQMGFPTANLALADARKLIPATGVYAVRVRLADTTTLFNGMCNIGYRPTVGGNQLGLEVHIFDFERNIYDHPLTLFFMGRLREEKKFPDLNALQAQLECDKALALSMLGGIG